MMKDYSLYRFGLIQQVALPLTFLSIIVLACQQESRTNKSSIESAILDTAINLSNAERDTTASVLNPHSENHDTMPTHVFKSGDTLWDLCRIYYGNRHYSAILSIYNDIENVNAIDPGTIIRIPPMKELFHDPKLGLTQVIPNEVDKILQARSLFMLHQKTLSDLRERVEGRNPIQLPELVEHDMQQAATLIEETMTSLKGLDTHSVKAPTKTIGQLKRLAANLDNLSRGNHDGPYKYDLDMVHQGLVHVMKNCIAWAKNGYE